MPRSTTHLFLALVLALAACGGGSKSTPPPNNPPTGGSGWTVLVYMVADNNLEGDGLKDLIEMSAAGVGNDLRFVVQVDRAVGFSSDPVLNLPDFTSTKRVLVQNGSLQQLADLGETNMADPAVLADFISWGVRTYPGQKYFLDFWDHGGAWLGFGWDDSTNNENLTLAKLRTGIQNGLTGAGLARFDIIGFDACLMATVEVIQSLKTYGSYFVVSEEVEPGHGWDYRAFQGGGALDAVALGRKVIDGFQAQAVAEGTSAGVTLSLVDAAQFDPVMTAITTLRGGFNATAQTATVATGRQAALYFGDSPDPTRATHMVDIDSLFKNATGVTGASALTTAVAGAVVYRIQGSGKSAARGLSIYFPPSAQYKSASYDAVPGMDDWRAFLTAYWNGATSAGSQTGGTPQFDLNNSTYTAAVSGLTIDGVLVSGTEGSVVDARLHYGLRTGAATTDAFYFGDQPATQSGTSVTGSWDWSVFGLIQGAYSEYGYLSISYDQTSGYGIASIPLNYYPTGGATPVVEALRQIVFDASTGNPLADDLYADTGGGMAALTPVAGSKIRTVVAYVTTPGAARQWLPWSDPASTTTGFDGTQAMDYGFGSLTTGAYYIGMLRAVNAAGNGDAIWTPAGATRP